MLASRARRYVWNVVCRQRRFAGEVALKEGAVEIIPFPREKTGLNYALNWALAAKAIPPSGYVFDNLENSELQEYGASPQESISGSKIYARGSFSSGAIDITKSRFNKLFKEVARHLSSCDNLFIQDGSIGASTKHIKVRAVCDNPSAAGIFRSTLCSTVERGESPLSIYVVSIQKPNEHYLEELPENAPFMAADYDRSALIVGGHAFADVAALKNAMAAIAIPAIVAGGALPLKARVLALGDHRVIVAGPDSIIAKDELIQASVFPDEGIIWNENGATRFFNTHKAAVPKLVSPTALVLVTADSSGALPQVSRLSPEQSGFHYLAGYNDRAYTPVYNAGLVSVDPVILAKKMSAMLTSTKLPAFLVNAYNVKSGKELVKLIERAANPKEPKSNEDAAKAWSNKHKDHISKTFPKFYESSS